MIATSDLIILVVSASALGLGLYRWQQNTTAPAVAAVPVETRTVTDAPERPVEPLVGRPASADDPDDGGVPASNGEGAGALVAERVAPVPEPEPSRREETGANAETTPSSAVEIPRPPAERDAAPPVASVDGASDALTTTSSGADGTLYGLYRVQAGDYLGLIAERFGTSVSNLRTINDIEGNLIFVGQELRYPLPAN